MLILDLATACHSGDMMLSPLSANKPTLTPATAITAASQLHHHHHHHHHAIQSIDKTASSAAPPLTSQNSMLRALSFRRRESFAKRAMLPTAPDMVLVSSPASQISQAEDKQSAHANSIGKKGTAAVRVSSSSARKPLYPPVPAIQNNTPLPPPQPSAAAPAAAGTRVAVHTTSTRLVHHDQPLRNSHHNHNPTADAPAQGSRSQPQDDEDIIHTGFSATSSELLSSSSEGLDEEEDADNSAPMTFQPLTRGRGAVPASQGHAGAQTRAERHGTVSTGLPEHHRSLPMETRNMQLAMHVTPPAQPTAQAAGETAAAKLYAQLAQQGAASKAKDAQVLAAIAAQKAQEADDEAALLAALASVTQANKLQQATASDALQRGGRPLSSVSCTPEFASAYMSFSSSTTGSLSGVRSAHRASPSRAAPASNSPASKSLELAKTQSMAEVWHSCEDGVMASTLARRSSRQQYQSFKYGYPSVVGPSRQTMTSSTTSKNAAAAAIDSATPPSKTGLEQQLRAQAGYDDAALRLGTTKAWADVALDDVVLPGQREHTLADSEPQTEMRESGPPHGVQTSAAQSTILRNSSTKVNVMANNKSTQ